MHKKPLWFPVNQIFPTIHSRLPRRLGKIVKNTEICCPCKTNSSCPCCRCRCNSHKNRAMQNKRRNTSFKWSKMELKRENEDLPKPTAPTANLLLCQPFVKKHANKSQLKERRVFKTQVLWRFVISSFRNEMRVKLLPCERDRLRSFCPKFWIGTKLVRKLQWDNPRSLPPMVGLKLCLF